MNVVALPRPGLTPQAALASGSPRWGGAFGFAATAHILALGAILILTRPFAAPLPDPVMVVELPPPAASPSPATAQPQVDQQPDQPRPVTPVQPLIDVPQLRSPPPDAAIVPVRPVEASPRPAPLQAAPAAPPVRQVAPTTATSIGDDPKAKKAQADYSQILLAYIRRNKTYPVEARKAREQGTPSVRFTVDRSGNVSALSLKRGSGHSSLDGAAVALIQKISPMPPMPAAMKQDSFTVSVPIEYTLKN